MFEGVVLRGTVLCDPAPSPLSVLNALIDVCVNVFKKWMNTDPHRDFVMTMGPIHSGKSELRDAYLGKPYKGDRMETTSWKNPVKLGERGSKYCIAIPDFGGTTNQAKPYCTKILEEIEKRQPEYILTQFVFDVSKLTPTPDGMHEVADSLQFYLNMLNKSLEGVSDCHAQKVCSNGHWFFEIVGTHRDQTPGIPNTDPLLEIKKYMGHLRPVGRRVTLLDLCSLNGREESLQHLIETLEKIHEE